MVFRHFCHQFERKIVSMLPALPRPTSVVVSCSRLENAHRALMGREHHGIHAVTPLTVFASENITSPCGGDTL